MAVRSERALEQLAMFLPQNRDDYVFELPERTRLDGQPAIRIDYRFRRP